MAPNHQVKVSVLISTYNRANFLPEAIDSLLKQTRVPDEIIVVDDGSTDNTPEVLAKYGAPVISIYQANKGAASGRNTAWRASSGDLITFLDSDDTLAPTSIERRASYLETHPAINIVYTGAHMTDMQGNVLSWFRKPPLPEGMIFSEIIARHAFPIHAVMFRRICISMNMPFDESLTANEDYDLWVRLAADNLIASINEPLANYRVHNNMMTGSSDHILNTLIKLYERVDQMPKFQQLAPREKALFYWWRGARYHELGRVAEAQHFYIKAIQHAPDFARAYYMLPFTLLGKQGYYKSTDLYRMLKQLATPFSRQ